MLVPYYAAVHMIYKFCSKDSLNQFSIYCNYTYPHHKHSLVLQDLATEEQQSNLLTATLGKQTWSRYIVENYLQHYKWYNPNLHKSDAPNLSKGWAYFEHFTLPRRFDSKSGGHHIRAPPGEREGTKLYSAFMTPQESLSDWGIGMGMYFSSLSTLCIIFILAGCLNIYNMIYYSSPEYDISQIEWNLVDMLHFSVVCTDREWVVCADTTDTTNENGVTSCKNEEALGYWDSIFTNSYYGTAEDGTVLINKTTCNPATFKQGMVNYGTLMLLILCMSLYMWYLSKREIRFDEDNTSAPDYTVVVHNPPQHNDKALDPDEWRDFFDQFSDKGVTLVTVALNNEVLLTKLVQRRKDIKALKRCFPSGMDVDIDNEGAVNVAVENAKRYRKGEEASQNCIAKFFSSIFLPVFRRLGIALTEETLWKRIRTTTEEIKKLQQEEYQAAAVYVTFETEEGQRTALAALKASQTEIITNKPITLDASCLFQEHVLHIEEAPSVTAVRWKDLHYTRTGVWLRVIISCIITFGLVAFSAIILNLARTRVNTILYSILLSTFNSLIPVIVRLLVSFEKHWDEGSMQASLYFNITLFRWVNTAIVTRVITPFLVTLGENKIDLVNTVNALMISEMIIAPLLRYFDFMTIVNRHIFAPRAKTEEELFSCFKGGWYSLAERFTDFTKVLLLCTFYSAVYPLIYFLGAAILFGQYWMDKFLLLRSWQKQPKIGVKTAEFSRTYFNTAAILLGAISSAYVYARSPFTNLCSCDINDKECGAVPDTQFTNVQLLNGETTDITEDDLSNEVYYFCNQDQIGFPPIPAAQDTNIWMMEDQEKLSKIYGWTAFWLLISYCVFVLGWRTILTALSLVKGVYKVSI